MQSRNSVSTTAASELVGTLILTSLIILVIGIVSVALLSQGPPAEVPALRVDIHNDSGNLTLINRGGDTLFFEKTRIFVDGVDRTANFFLEGESWREFGAGDWLVLPGLFREDVSVQIVHIGPDVPALLFTIGDIGVPPGPWDQLVAEFTSNVRNGGAPLTVHFTDLSNGSPIEWIWNFGDGSTSTEQNPAHTYLAPGTYTVSLTVKKNGVQETETKVGYIVVDDEESFVHFIINENVFVYGNVLSFAGNSVTGPGSTVVITGGLDTADTNLGASIDVSTIYIDGDVMLSDGSAGLGSQSHPGNIYVNGNLDLWTGSRNIYGDVYVAGDFRLKDARIHGNIYVDGSLELGWTPLLADDARIYYTGTITHPANYNANILAKCIHQPTVPGFDMPDQDIPPTKSAGWYTARGYITSGALTSNMKVFADSYSSTSWQPTATNVIIIARTGDITITGMGGSGVTGVFFAPNGRVTFNGAFLEGVVIARDGFYVTSGGTQVTFKNLDQYIGDPNDYPF
ncbi:hypothetical protein RJ53_00310 [Methanocalculus chunghsingensis]|uniref:PKD domain-containing protein n=2 Tax=Methanocalculus chunghsingensis TaxID=156457 RepID=A0A8J7W814_9EURY|nr:hypothetical protein [Methanocalculus chunghsingensis]